MQAQEEEIKAKLLSSIPRGEPIKDSREGDFFEATVTNPELVEQSGGHSIKVTYSNLADANGRAFEYQERYTIPTANSPEFIGRLWLGFCHATEILPRSDRAPMFAETEEERQAMLALVQGVVGNKVALRLTQDTATGYMRSKFITPKK